MSRREERLIENLYKAIYKKIFTKEIMSKLEKGSRDVVFQKILRLKTSKSYDQMAIRLSKELAKIGLSQKKGQWRKYFEQARKSGYIALDFKYKDFQLETLSKIVQKNFKMIKSIPEKQMELLNHKYTSTLMEQTLKGQLPRGSFEKELRQHGWKNAKVIARTETSKLQTAITETRSTSLGSVAYEWVSSSDIRTRPSHKQMDGVIVFWRGDLEKPLRDNMRGNAGEFPNCRCYSSPIFDEADLTKSTYKVYDYRTDKIITMNKKSLVEALNRGSL